MAVLSVKHCRIGILELLSQVSEVVFDIPSDVIIESLKLFSSWGSVNRIEKLLDITHTTLSPEILSEIIDSAIDTCKSEVVEWSLARSIPLNITRYIIRAVERGSYQTLKVLLKYSLLEGITNDVIMTDIRIAKDILRKAVNARQYNVQTLLVCLRLWEKESKPTSPQWRSRSRKKRSRAKHSKKRRALMLELYLTAVREDKTNILYCLRSMNKALYTKFRQQLLDEAYLNTDAYDYVKKFR